MDGQQCLKLSLTNRSIGLISPHKPRHAQQQACSQQQLDAAPPVRYSSLTCTEQAKLSEDASVLSLGDLVVMARCQTPDPIPNSAVKSLRANGTAS